MSSQPSYGPASRLLHQLALSTNFIGEVAFDIELSTNKKNLTDHQSQHHVFVAGLARAGTTLLMRLLYDSGQYGSLTYRDMPFVVAPNLWGKINAGSRKDMAAQERAHGDGVMVNYDSPEALEEVFWRMVTEGGYIHAKSLLAMSADSEQVEKFRQYINLILLKTRSTRYLSKNNNNILRLPSINRAFPSATILVPFRSPLQHAQSLLNQHLRFSSQQSSDKFVGRYMTWLGHHEFGLDHRPFQFSASVSPSQYSLDSLEYWLERWVEAYSHVLKIIESESSNTILFSYELFCHRPKKVIASLDKLLELDDTLKSDFEPTISIADGLEVTDKPLLKRAEDIYQLLDSQCKSMLL